MAWWIWLIIILVIVIGIFVALYIVGNKMQKKQAAQSFTDNSGNSTAVASGFEYNYKEQVAENI